MTANWRRKSHLKDAASTFNRPKTRPKLTHRCGFSLGVSCFSHLNKTSFVILIGRIILFHSEISLRGLGEKTTKKRRYICYSPAERSVLGETVPKVLTAEGGTQTERTVSPNTNRPSPVNNIFIFFQLRFKSFRKIFLHSTTYVC